MYTNNYTMYQQQHFYNSNNNNIIIATAITTTNTTSIATNTTTTNNNIISSSDPTIITAATMTSIITTATKTTQQQQQQQHQLLHYGQFDNPIDVAWSAAEQTISAAVAPPPLASTPSAPSSSPLIVGSGLSEFDHISPNFANISLPHWYVYIGINYIILYFLFFNFSMNSYYSR